MAGARKFKFNADTPSFICAAAVRVRKGTLGTLSCGRSVRQLRLQVVRISVWVLRHILCASMELLDVLRSRLPGSTEAWKALCSFGQMVLLLRIRICK